MTTLSSAADILRCFSADRHEITVSQAVRLLGMPKSNASRLLRAMRDCGMLETIGDSKRYRPSLLLHEAGRVYRSSSTLIQRADQIVAEICAQTGHTGYVSTRDGQSVVAVTDHPGTNPLRVTSNIGHRLAALATATGRTLLARRSDDEIRAIFATFPKPPSAQAPQSVDELLMRVSQVRRDGFAIVVDEMSAGVSTVAVAVGDPETKTEVSMCISFPSQHVPREEQLRVARELHRGAMSIAVVTGDKSLPAFAAPARDAA